MGQREGGNHRRQVRSILYGVAAVILSASGARSQEADGGSSAQPQGVTGFTATRVAAGLTQPLFVTAPPGDVNHLFIVQQTGQILMLDLRTGKIRKKPFFNISGMLASTSGEQGLLGMAFDPNYASNGKFYLNFTAPGGAFGNGVTQLSRTFRT